MPEEKFQLSDRYGSFVKTGDVYSVRFERILDHPVEKVWKAITETDQLAIWLGPTEIDPEEGGEVRVKTKGGTMGGKIIQWEENTRLEYSWWKDTIVRYELFAEGMDRCRLVFTCSLLPAAIGKSAATGWHYHMDALTIVLADKKMPEWPIESWERISRIAAAHYTILLHEAEEKRRIAAIPLILERTFDAPIAEVWKAITEKERMKQWYFDIAAFKPEVGFEFTFTAEHEENLYVHYCCVTEVIPGRRLAYTWRHRNLPGISLLTFDLSPEGDRTRLKLTHEGLENFVNNGPDFSRESHLQGWTYFLDQALIEFLATHRIVTMRVN